MLVLLSNIVSYPIWHSLNVGNSIFVGCAIYMIYKRAKG